ncbi:ferric-chelate reductase Frp1 [Tilletia horrida]|nr:ferric-chelate reductase Frp1 [Tilletia horrida]
MSANKWPQEVLRWNAGAQQRDHDYPLYLLAVLYSALGLFVAKHLLHLLSRRLDPRSGYQLSSTRSQAVKLLDGLRDVCHKYLELSLFELRNVFAIPVLQALLIACMAATSFAVTFVNAPDSPASSPIKVIGFSNRAAICAVSLLPFVTALAGRNNIVSALTGVPYERLQTLHRWSARLLLVLILIHAGAKMGSMGSAHEIFSRAQFRYGFAAFLLGTLILVCSHRLAMRIAYDLFAFSHTVLVLVFMIMGALHSVEHRAYFYVTFGLWAWDRIARLLKTGRLRLAQRHHHQHTNLMPADMTVIDAETLRVDISLPTTFPAWAAGSHAFLWTPSLRSAGFPYASHPFSIASPSAPVPTADIPIQSNDRPRRPCLTVMPNPATVLQHTYSQSSIASSMKIFPSQAIIESTLPLPSHTSTKQSEPTTPEDHSRRQRRMMTFLIAKRQGWTKAIYEAVAARGGRTRDITVLVQGPYSSAHDLCTGYDSVLLVAGGKGITWALSVLLELLRRRVESAAAIQVRALRLVWIIRHPSQLPFLTSLLQTYLPAQHHPQLRGLLEVHIYITSQSPTTAVISDAEKACSTSLDEVRRSLPLPADILHLWPGRPNVGRMLNEAVIIDNRSARVFVGGKFEFLPPRFDET